jgi:hypothetical protein
MPDKAAAATASTRTFSRLIVETAIQCSCTVKGTVYDTGKEKFASKITPVPQNTCATFAYCRRSGADRHGALRHARKELHASQRASHHPAPWRAASTPPDGGDCVHAGRGVFRPRLGGPRDRRKRGNGGSNSSGGGSGGVQGNSGGVTGPPGSGGSGQGGAPSRTGGSGGPGTGGDATTAGTGGGDPVPPVGTGQGAPLRVPAGQQHRPKIPST